MEVVNYKDEVLATKPLSIDIDNLIAIHGAGKHCLVLTKLKSMVKRFDGTKAKYRLEHRELSQECVNPDDESYCCVFDSDVTLWTKDEIANLDSIKRDQRSLFDSFNLF